jgi:hypothetical protein
VAALVIVAAFAGVVTVLFRVADQRDADRAAQQAKESTTMPTTGLDREPTGGPPPAPATPATTVPAVDDEGPPVILRGDGIGAFHFGADPDQVLAGLTLRWGPPDGDSGWIAAPSSPYGTCPGTVVRGVNWRGFTVLFSDGATPRGTAGTRHFFAWEYRVDDPARPGPDAGGNRPALTITGGVSVGTTVKALQAVYGDRVELFDEAPDGPQFGVQTSEGGIYGSLTGLDASGIVLSIVSGGGCGE